MLNGKRVVVCIPYGRKRTVSILLSYLRRDRKIVDEVQFWMNTDADQTYDREWAYEQARTYEGWVRCVELSSTVTRLHPKQLNTGKFYDLTRDSDTYYIRMDDDIVYVHPDYFRNLIAFREANPEPFLVFGTIFNNATTSYLLQQAGKLEKDNGIVDSPWCMDPIAWRSPNFAIYIHRAFLKALDDGEVEKFYLDAPYYLRDAARFSISNFVWLADDFAGWGYATPIDDEEIWLAERYPKAMNVTNVVAPNALVSHYSFFDQRPALDQTDILERYRYHAERALSEAYYDLLAAS